MMKRINIAFFALVSACLLSCSQPAPSLEGKWDFATVKGEQVRTSEKEAFLVFDAGESRVHGCLGVNIVNGGYTQKGDSLSFGMLASTMMAGLPEDMDTESKLSTALVSVRTASVKGDELSLKNASGETVLTLVRTPETEQQEDGE